MSLDISFSAPKGEICPHCGGVVKAAEMYSAESGGRAWYPILEELGYYVPYEQRTEENNWYAKDMALTAEQTRTLYEFVKNRKDLYNREVVLGLIATAIVDECAVVINADW